MKLALWFLKYRKYVVPALVIGAAAAVYFIWFR